MIMRVSPEKEGGANANTAFVEDKKEAAKAPRCRHCSVF
jgi:hypothetical protein